MDDFIDDGQFDSLAKAKEAEIARQEAEAARTEREEQERLEREAAEALQARITEQAQRAIDLAYKVVKSEGKTGPLHDDETRTFESDWVDVKEQDGATVQVRLNTQTQLLILRSRDVQMLRTHGKFFREGPSPHMQEALTWADTRLAEEVNGQPVYSEIQEAAIRFYPGSSHDYARAAIAFFHDGQETDIAPDTPHWDDVEAILAAFEASREQAA